MAVMEEAPVITDHLCDDCRDHFAQVTSLLDDIEVSYRLEPRLVRGLDYYTRTAFEFLSPDLGSQNAVGGGGRYDGLAESLGGPPLPGIGFALGVDRIVLARQDAADAVPVLDVFVVTVGPEAAPAGFRTRHNSAPRGSRCRSRPRRSVTEGTDETSVASGARWAAIVGEKEIESGRVTVKDLATSEQRDVALDDLAEVVRS